VRARRARYGSPFIAAVLVFATLATATVCQGADDDLMGQGSADLTEGRFSEAFAKFAKAAAARPDDPEPLFFCGVASNRLGEHEEALFYFDRAKAKDYRALWKTVVLAGLLATDGSLSHFGGKPFDVLFLPCGL
jgi:tetratricopeptide (TPR) repeat protein